MNKRQLINVLTGAYSQHDTVSFNGFDFVHAFGSARDALLYVPLFWPEFIEFQGMTFFEFLVETDDDKQRVIEFYEAHNRNRTLTQQAFNLVEVSYLFGKRSGEADDFQELCLAEMLCEIWAHRLKGLFPGRQFTVRIVPREEVDSSIAILVFETPTEAETHTVT
jgi:hypothetical protein